MESRVSSLETHMEYVRRDLDELRVGQATIIDRLNHIPTKADLDTWRWQWLATGLAIVALTVGGITGGLRSEEHTSELQSLMRISYAVFCLKKKKDSNNSIENRISPKIINITIDET